MKAITINIIDYGMGNLQSVRNAVERLGCAVKISSEPSMLLTADAIILPGVGAFGEAMNNLHQRKLVTSLRQAVLDEGKPLLGICLGMQLLADSSDERGSYQGLSLIPGHVKAIPAPVGYRLPHIGWNNVTMRHASPLFTDIVDDSAFYFVHSYYFECSSEYVRGITDYGVDIVAAVQKEHILGVQFHPERSQRKGLHLLSNFVKFVASTIDSRCN